MTGTIERDDDAFDEDALHCDYDDDAFDEDALHCDYCETVESAADLPPDWNGETGNHLSCEAERAASDGAPAGQRAYVVQAHDPATLRQLPTFYLLANVQGITDAVGAERIARDIIGDTGETVYNVSIAETSL